MQAAPEQPDSGKRVFRQVSRDPTLSDRVVSEITEAVTSGRILPGERLQSERELAEEFGVSRTVVREAIRSLSAHGLVESRSGRGVQVATVGPDAVNRSMSLFLLGNSGIDYGQVHEVRSALEVQMAGLAAQRATEEDISRLSNCIELMSDAGSDLERLARLDVDFHRGLAAATHNELFTVILGSIDDVMLEVRRSAFAEPALATYAITAHRAILEAIGRGARTEAREAMRAHLKTSEQAWTGRARTPRRKAKPSRQALLD